MVISGLYILQIFTLRNVDDFQVRRFKFVWAVRKRDYPLHLRLIACTALIPLEAAVERLLINAVPFLVPNFDVALTAGLIFMEVTVLALVVGELIWRRVRWPFPFLLAYYLVMHSTVTPVANNGTFQSFAWAFARFGT